jgi:hypothetical protein
MLQAFGYDAPTETLAIRFSATKVYHYKNVPQDVYSEFSKSESIGAAFGCLIRGQYESEMVLDEPETSGAEA